MRKGNSNSGGRSQSVSKSYEVGYKRPPAAFRFRKGVSGNPEGKRKKPKAPDLKTQKGSTSLKMRIVQEALLMAGEAIGEVREVKVTEIDDKGRKHTRFKNQETGIDGLVGYLRSVGVNHPAVFCSMLAKIIPMQGYVDTRRIIRGSVADLEALRAEIKRRGLKLEKFLESPNPIEATSTDAPSIAPATGNGHDPEKE